MSTTHFGYQTIEEDQKASQVRGVFDSVANRYDLMNDLMSAGLHRLWKAEMISALAPKDGMRILDVAGGTGDIAFRLLAKSACHVTLLDINREMLRVGQNRAIDQNLPGAQLEWVCADAEALPFPDAHFDAYTIAFGIRNVTRIERALAEAARVLKIGGRFLCLEFSHMPSATLQKLYDAYSFSMIPFIGERVTGDRAAYQYLVESIRRFPPQAEFAEMIRRAGLGAVNYRNMTGGVVALHSARKL